MPPKMLQGRDRFSTVQNSFLFSGKRSFIKSSIQNSSDNLITFAAAGRFIALTIYVGEESPGNAGRRAS